jgi:hypothetical protein
VLSFAPGIYVNPVGGVWFFMRGQIPFLKQLYGEQDVLPSVALGFQYQIL